MWFWCFRDGKGVWWVVVDLEVEGLLEELSEYPKIIKKMEQTSNEVGSGVVRLERSMRVESKMDAGGEVEV